MTTALLPTARGISWLLVLALFVTSHVCSAEREAGGMKTIEGTIWYRERMALPPNAQIRVSLEDVARMDVPSEVIATTNFAPEGGTPWAFTLEYDPQRLHDKGRYVLRARIEANGRLLFINPDSIPAFGHHPGKPVKVLVSRVPGSRSGEGAKVPAASLTETYWKLIELDGQAAGLGTGGRELHMVLTGEGNLVHGFSGCNRFSGGYQGNGGKLTFTQLASTRMACIEGMDLEQRFLDALHRTSQFTIQGNSLALYSGDDQQTMRFMAVALR